MNLELSEEQRTMRDTVRDYVTRFVDVRNHARALVDDPLGTTDEVWRGLTGLGTTGLLIPEAQGGSSLSMIEAGLVLEELGAKLYSGPWSSTAVASVRLLTRAGVDAPELYGSIADGSLVLTTAVDSTGISAPRAPEMVLAGTLDGVADVAAADLILVIAHVLGQPRLCAVRTSDERVSFEPLPSIDLTRRRFRVSLAGARARDLGPVDRECIDAVTDDLLVIAAAEALGAARALLDLAVSHAKVRKQFGKPIGAFQAVQHLCADMYEAVELMRSSVIHALWSADNTSPAEYHLAAVRLKAMSGQLTMVGDNAVQVLGGIGYTWEHDAHLYLRRLLDWSRFRGEPSGYLQEVARWLIASNVRRSVDAVS
ncbi:acyl-CoA dehydrogenase family protein [Mycobacterium sp. NPDC051804]|uniref:acyl-CoA dehydrogenase family protein n=1 Tax=Mycobacterium sp. NPDC051804 TaxID=3364295 RepID=UPI0037AB2ADF